MNNPTDGATGFPIIAAHNHLTIRDNGATITRSAAPGTPAFRLFDVASGAALTLENLTLANGLVIAEPRMDGCGCAILNAAGASLTVKCSAFTGNQVVGGDGGGDLGGLGCGGALWNDGTANVEYVIFRDNQATGGATTSPDPANYDIVLGGLGWGGAVSSQDQGTLTVRNCWFTGNRAVGGHRHQSNGQYDGDGASGAIDNWGVASISETAFTDNQAIGCIGDAGVDGGFAIGGAVGNGGKLADSPECTIQNCTFRHNLAIAADGGQGKGGGYAVDTGALFGFPDTASVTLNGGSKVNHNHPDDAFHF